MPLSGEKLQPVQDINTPASIPDASRPVEFVFGEYVNKGQMTRRASPY